MSAPRGYEGGEGDPRRVQGHNVADVQKRLSRVRQTTASRQEDRLRGWLWVSAGALGVFVPCVVKFCLLSFDI